MSDHEITVIRQVWDKRNGTRFEIGADRDGLAMPELRYYTDDGELTSSVIIHDEVLPLLIQAMSLYLNDRKTGVEPTT